MSDSLLSELHEKIRSADLLYHRMVSVVGPPRSGKTRILQALSKAAGVSVLNVSLELGRLLLDLPQKRRGLDAPGLLGHIVESCQTGPAILDNLEILFDAQIKLDPLACLRQLSRNRVLVVSFSGVLADEHLIYAEPGHPEYRRFPAADILTVVVGQPPLT